MCSDSSYLRLIDLVYHPTLGLRVIKKKKKFAVDGVRGKTALLDVPRHGRREMQYAPLTFLCARYSCRFLMSEVPLFL